MAEKSSHWGEIKTIKRTESKKKKEEEEEKKVRH